MVWALRNNLSVDFFRAKIAERFPLLKIFPPKKMFDFSAFEDSVPDASSSTELFSRQSMQKLNEEPKPSPSHEAAIYGLYIQICT